MALKGCYGFLKWMVFFFNLIFWFVGVGVLAVSLWLLFDSAFYLQVAKGADSYSAGTFTLLAAGALMTIIGFLGCCGALRESQCLLGTFFVFLMIILVAEIAGGVWAYMNKAELSKMVQENVRDTVRTQYSKDKVKTETFDLIQKELKCCGSDGYSSWSSSAYNGVEGSAPIEIGITAPVYKLPKSCCVDPESEICDRTRNAVAHSIISSSVGVIHSEGCVSKLEAILEQYTAYFFVAAIGIGIIELLGMIFSMLLCCAIRKIEDFKA